MRDKEELIYGDLKIASERLEEVLGLEKADQKGQDRGGGSGKEKEGRWHGGFGGQRGRVGDNNAG